MDITLDGKTFEELGLRISADYQRPMSAPTRDKTMTIGGKHGAWDFGADLDPKPFSLPCTLIEQDQEGLQQAINKITDHSFDSTGRPRTLRLVFGDEPEKYTYVRFSGDLPIDRIVGIGQFTLPLVAFDPFSRAPSDAYDPTETYEYDAGYEYDSGLMYANSKEFHWRYRRQYIGLYNYSGIETPVRIVIEGSVINPRITNQTTGQKLTVGAGLIDGHAEVDAEWFFARGQKVKERTPKDKWFFLSAGFPIKYTEVERTGTQYFLAELSGDYPFLAPGLNSLLLEGGLPDAIVTVVWEHRFM